MRPLIVPSSQSSEFFPARRNAFVIRLQHRVKIAARPSRFRGWLVHAVCILAFRDYRLP